MDHEKRHVSMLVHFVRECGVIFANSQDAIEIGVRGRALQQTCILQLFDIGKIAQGRQSKHRQKLEAMSREPFSFCDCGND